MSGRLVDKITGAPLSGADVTLDSVSGDDGAPRTDTARRCRFRVGCDEVG